MTGSRKKNAIIYTVFSIIVFAPTIAILIIMLLSSNGKAEQPSGDTDDTLGSQVLPSQPPTSEQLMTLTVGAVPIETLPAALTDSVCSSISYEGREYCFYFAKGNAYCAYTVDKKEHFIVSDASFEAFLTLSGGKKAAHVPILQNAGETIYPISQDLSITDGNGEKIQLEPYPLPTTLIIDPDARLELVFDVAPSSCTAFVYDGESVVFGGSLSALADADLSGYRKLTCRIDAEWSDETRTCGSAVYCFELRTSASTEPEHEPLEISLADKLLCEGEYTVLSIKNVRDKNTLFVSVSPTLTYAPTVHERENGEYFSLIAVKCGCDVDEYTVTVEADGEAVSETLKIEERAYRERSYDASELLITISRSEAALSEYESIKSAIFDTRSDELYADAVAIDHTQTVFRDSNIYLGFGYYRALSDGTKYQMDGVDYKLGRNEDVTAVTRGCVLHVGYSQYLGNYVVLDHGGGMRTWYTHLSETRAELGSIVEGGACIGRSGVSGFTTTCGTYLMCTVHNVHVSPYKLVEQGFFG